MTPEKILSGETRLIEFDVKISGALETIVPNTLRYRIARGSLEIRPFTPITPPSVEGIIYLEPIDTNQKTGRHEVLVEATYDPPAGESEDEVIKTVLPYDVVAVPGA